MQRISLYMEKQPRIPQILVIDDEHQLHQDLKYAFDGEYNFIPIVSVKDQHVVVNFIENNYFDLVLLDLHFEGQGKVGLTLLKTLRKEFPNLSVIVITNYNNNRIITTLRKYRSTAYLFKQEYSPLLWQKTIDDLLDQKTKEFELPIEDLAQIRSTILRSTPCTQEVKLNYFPNNFPNNAIVTAVVISGYDSLVTTVAYQFIQAYWERQISKPMPITQLSLRLCNCSSNKTTIDLLRLNKQQSATKVTQRIHSVVDRVTCDGAATKVVIEVENISYH